MKWDSVTVNIHVVFTDYNTNLFGSFVSERISKSSSFDKKKKRGK